LRSHRHRDVSNIVISPTLPAILIVEDERIVARDLQETLIEMGYDPYAIASSADEAMNLATTRCPDIVLMDIRIKGSLDGIETAALLAEKCRTPVVFLTANADVAMVERAKRIEPHGYLQKPIKPSDLRNTIEIALHKRELDKTRIRLRTTEQRLYTITDNLPAFIGYIDHEDRMQFANRTFRDCARTEGYELGMPAERFLNDTPFRATADRRRSAQGGQDASFTVQWETKEMTRTYEASYLADIDAAGQVAGVYALATDVTDVRNSYARVRELAQRLESVREDERRAAATALHEGIAQDLYAMKLGLQYLEAQAARRAGVTQACQELTLALSKCMDDTRQIADELRPAALAHLGLRKPLTDYAATVSRRSTLRITVSADEAFRELDERQTLLFFRAAQEALSNVTRHAQAGSVDIHLRAAAEGCTMQIMDDGIGITPRDADKPGCLGLLGIRERFEALRGSLVVTGRQPQGTVFMASLPTDLPKERHAH
jgi:signal transduction histidine kinase